MLFDVYGPNAAYQWLGLALVLEIGRASCRERV